VILLALAATAVFSGHVRIGHRLRWVFVVIVVAYAVSGQERLQRFTTLQDSDLVADRVAGSVNLGFLDLAARYPLGNGLGGGGTSIPYFLQSRIRNSVYMENEYARIALEQGVPGVLAWVLFLFWLFTRSPRGDESWFLARRLLKIGGACWFASAVLGTGLGVGSRARAGSGSRVRAHSPRPRLAAWHALSAPGSWCAAGSTPLGAWIA
jgi:hypothetical protein